MSRFMGAYWPLVLPAVAGAAFLLGSHVRPETEMSELAAAQLITHDKHVQWVGFCGSTTIIARDMEGAIPEDWTSCREVRNLDEEILLIDEPLS